MIAGTTTQAIVESIDKMLRKDKDCKNPFGDGKAVEKIVEILFNGCNL